MKNRWVVLLAGIVIQTMLGGVYAWSTFVPYLVNNYALTKGQCGFVFGLTIGVFTLAMTLAGRILPKKGPRFTASIGAVLFIIGYVSSSFSNGNYYLLLLSIGVIAGSGIGFGYVCPLSVGMKWFPEKKGLVTGVSVAGFGGGAVLLSSVAGYFLQNGMDVLQFFRWVGMIPGFTLVVAALFLATPPSEEISAPKAYIESPMLTIPFGIMTLGLFSGTFSGLLVIGNLTPIVSAAGLTAAQAVVTVSIFALGNAIGRVTWGYVFDRFSFKSIPLSLGVSALFVVLLLLPMPHWAVMVATGLLGFSFGGNFVIYAASISRYFGVRMFAKLYPICFLGYGAAGITGPAIGGWLADRFGTYDVALYLSIGLVSIATIISVIGMKSFKVKAIDNTQS